MAFWRDFFGLEKRDSSGENNGLQYVGGYSDALTFGQLMNRYSAMNISAVFAATNLISNTLAMLPIKVQKKATNGKNEVDTHPLNLVFGDKNTDNNLSKFTLIKMLVQSVILKGNGFAYIDRANDGTVKGLRFLESSDVIIYYNKQRNLLYYDAPVISKKHIEPINMLHFILHSYDGINGLSVLSYANRTLAVTNASENSAKAFFENGMNVNGLLKVNTPLNAKQKEEIRSSWQQAYSGNGGGLAIINGNMEYTQLQLSPEDSQLLSSRKFNVEDIARFFNINPILIGGEGKATYSSLEMLQQAFLVHTIQPYVTMIENELNRKLLKPSENKLSIVMETNELLRINKQSQAAYYQTMVNSGILSINEVRKDLGFNPIEGGDEHHIAFSSTDKNLIGSDGEQKAENKEENGTE